MHTGAAGHASRPQNPMKKFLPLLLAASAAFAGTNDVQVRFSDLGLTTLYNRKVTIQAVATNIYSPFIVSREPKIQNTDTNGSVTFTNVVPATYDLTLASTPPTTVRIGVTNNGTTNAMSAVGLIGIAVDQNSLLSYTRTASDAKFALKTNALFYGNEPKLNGTNFSTLYSGGGGSGNATNFPYLDITNNTPGWREGRLAYDTNTHTFVAYNDRSNVTYNVGEELFVRCLNSSGSTISNGQLVTFSSTGGGTVPRITLAQASLVSAASDFPCLGMATENISNGDSGMITVHGIVRDVYTDNWEIGRAHV